MASRDHAHASSGVLDRVRIGCGVAWFVAVPFVLLGAPERCQDLGAIMGFIVGVVLSSPAPALSDRSREEP